MRLPLASHAPFADDLALEGGYRYSKYSLGFDTNTYKLGLEWAPVHDIRLRGSFQRAVRAPNIGELFTPQAVGLDGSHDPCSGRDADEATLGSVRADRGDSAAQFGHIAPNPAFQYNGLFGGNPNLVPETADTYTVGLLLNPRSCRTSRSRSITSTSRSTTGSDRSVATRSSTSASRLGSAARPLCAPPPARSGEAARDTSTIRT